MSKKQLPSQYLSALQEATRTSNTSQGVKTALSSLVKIAARAMNAAGCSIMLLDSRKEHLVHSASYGLSDWYLRKGLLNANHTIDDKPVAIMDALKDPRIQYPQEAEKAGIASILSLPLSQKGEIIGAIRAYTHDKRPFSRQDRAFLAAIADLSALVIERATLEELTQKTGESEGEEDTGEKPRHPLRQLPAFAHPSEKEFARLLDFYRIEWIYEPRSFPLRWEGEEITEMFTPDFYLAELDLYIELTTLKQNLITEKNRKLRRLRELYPEVNIKLLNKKDYSRLLVKYGYGPLKETKLEGVERVLFSNNHIQRRVRQLAGQISKDYAGKRPLFIGVLKGVMFFMADLMRQVSLPIALEFMAISYYRGVDSKGVKITKDLDVDIAGRDLLMVEDIVDTGMTLNYLLGYLRHRNPASLRVCTLLDKRVRRLVEVPLDYVGFEIPDEFVVGYGLDYRGEYRNLPFIGVLNPEKLNT